jgi:hypothetical protein
MEGITSPCIISQLPAEFYISCVEDSILSISEVEMEAEIFQKFPKFESLCRILSEQLLLKIREILTSIKHHLLNSDICIFLKTDLNYCSVYLNINRQVIGALNPNH